MLRRKRFITRSMALTLTTILSAGVMAGCNQKEPEVANTDLSGSALKLPFEEPVTFRIWETFPSAAAAVMKSYGESEFYKELEKRTNVRLEYLHPVEGQGKEQFNLMIASGELPDLILSGFGDYQGGRLKAYEDGIIIDLKELIPKYAPDLAKIYETYPDLLMDAETEAGQQLFFPFIRGHERLYTFFGGFMRRDWLEELELEVPETVDDWYTTLKAFKEKKGADAPFTGNVGNIKGIYFTGAWGIDQNHFIEDGKVVYGAIDPRFKEYAKTMAKWYEEGLLDPELATNDTKNIDAKITGNKSGAAVGNAGGSLGKYLPLMKGTEFDLIATPYLVRKEGDFNPFIPKDGPVNSAGSVQITSACKNVAEAVTFLNYGYTEEGAMLYNFGIEGVSYNMENGYPKYTDLVMSNPNGQPVATMGHVYVRAFQNGPFVQDVRYQEQYMSLPQQQEAITTWTKFAKQVTEANKAYKGVLTADENSRIASKQNEINTYKDEMFLKWLMGRADIDATWDEYVAQIKKMGIEDINQVRQEAYDRFVQKFPQALNPQSFNVMDIFQR